MKNLVAAMIAALGLSWAAHAQGAIPVDALIRDLNDGESAFTVEQTFALGGLTKGLMEKCNSWSGSPERAQAFIASLRFDLGRVARMRHLAGLSNDEKKLFAKHQGIAEAAYEATIRQTECDDPDVAKAELSLEGLLRTDVLVD